MAIAPGSRETSLAPILDTSVLIDILIETRPRHATAKKLADLIRDKNWAIRFPYFGILEIASAIRQEAKAGPTKFADIFTADAPLSLETVAIDETFMTTYFDENLPYAKAGDLVFIAIARKEGRVLVTEDISQTKAALSGRIDVVNVNEYLSRLDVA